MEVPAVNVFENDLYRSIIIEKLRQIDLVMETEDCSVLDEWHFVSTAQRLACVLDDMEMLQISLQTEILKPQIIGQINEN